MADAGGTLLKAWGEVLVRIGAGSLRMGGWVMEWIGTGVVAAWRGIRRRPLQAAVVVGTLGLALGANTALFSVARALLIRSLPYEGAERIVTLEGPGMVSIRADDTWEIREEFSGLPGMEAASFYISDGSANLVGRGGAEQIPIAQVGAGFFDVMGVPLLMGSGLEAVAPGERAAVIAHGLWVRIFGGESEVLTRDLELNGRRYPIVGVAPPEVAFPGATQVWLTVSGETDFYGGAFAAEAVGRLRPGADRAAMTAALEEQIRPRLEAYAEAGLEQQAPRLVPLREHLVREVARPLWILMGAAGLVLLLGGLNLSGVWINQVLDRSDEITVRKALGASRGRVFRDLIAESLAVSCIGFGAALLVAGGLAGTVAARLPGDLPGVAAIGLDPLTVAFALGLALLTGALFGGFAALRGSRIRGRGGVSRGARRVQSGLALGQGALALVLVVGAGLMARSFERVATTPLGFESEGALTFRVRLPSRISDDRARSGEYFRTLREGIESIPGVRQVGLASSTPLVDGILWALQIRPSGSSDEQGTMAVAFYAGPGYFEAAGIPVLSGRPFDASSPSAGVILSAETAMEIFGTTNAAGEVFEGLRYSAAGPEWVSREVRAVVGEVTLRGPRVGTRPAVYYDLQSYVGAGIGVVVRTAVPPENLFEAVRAVALDVNPAVAPFGMRSYRDLARETISTDRALAAVGTGFSLTALLLAALGLYGLVSQQVTRRRRELGVRIAMGAPPESLVQRIVVRRGLGLGLGAIILGAPLALAVARTLEARLFEVGWLDPVTLGFAVFAVLGVCTFAAWLPARRITRVDPREVLSIE